MAYLYETVLHHFLALHDCEPDFGAGSGFQKKVLTNQTPQLCLLFKASLRKIERSPEKEEPIHTDFPKELSLFITL